MFLDMRLMIVMAKGAVEKLNEEWSGRACQRESDQTEKFHKISYKVTQRQEWCPIFWLLKLVYLILPFQSEFFAKQIAQVNYPFLSWSLVKTRVLPVGPDFSEHLIGLLKTNIYFRSDPVNLSKTHQTTKGSVRKKWQCSEVKCYKMHQMR